MTMRLSVGITAARDARTIIGTVTLLALAACRSSTGPGVGSLTVTISAPNGVRPAVTVTGPATYSKQLAATTTLTGLAVGEYVVAAVPITTPGPIVSTVNTPTIGGSPATVTAGGVANASATYAVGGSGGLWIANSNNSSESVVQFNAPQLAGTTSAAAASVLHTRLASSFGAAFEPSSDYLWVSSSSQNAVLGYAPSTLNAGQGTGSPGVFSTTLPDFTLSAPGAAALAWDSFDDLWVVNSGSGSISMYSSDDLYLGFEPYSPSLVLWPDSGSTFSPTGIAFDLHGNLWIANGAGNTLVEYTAAQTDTGGALTPAITLSANGNSIHGPLMLAFDRGGNLWVANGNQVNYSSVVEFSASQLAASGSPIPAVTLTPNAGSLKQPTGLAFDASGDLWVSNMAANTVVEFTSSQIASSGSPTPSVTLSGVSLSGPAGLVFDPPDSSLALVRMARPTRSVVMGRGHDHR